MPQFISKNFASFCAVCVIVVTLFVFVFRLVSIQAERDAKSDAISAIEAQSAQLKKELENLRAEKERLCNTEKIRHNPILPHALREVPNEEIIRVRTQSIPYGSGKNSAGARSLAVELTDLAALTKR